MHDLWRKARGSVRLRITFAATLVFALAFGVAAWAVVRAVQDRLEDQVRHDALMAVGRVASQIEGGTAAREAVYADGGALKSVVVRDAQGNVLATREFTAPLGPPVGAPAAAVHLDPMTGAPLSGEVLFVSVNANIGGENVTVLGSSPLAEVQRSVDALGQVLLYLTPVLVAGVGVLVWLLVGRALRPVAAITREVEEITHTTMHRRVPEPASNDEVHELARTMNDMLARLEAASERQRAFVSDASHELRTPVATVQALLEVGLRSGDVETAARRALEANHRLSDVVSDLLDLARLDGAPVAVDDLPVVDVEEIVLEVLGSEPDPLVDSSKVLAGRVRADRSLLARAVRNLVANARRHARSRVEVAVDDRAGEVVVTVDDDGPGVPPRLRERVFERFVRLDDGRRRRDGGTGIGLAIVRRVAEQHGGHVRISDAPIGGARFELTLPAARTISISAARPSLREGGATDGGQLVGR
jgi:signal transduction histidine kinase